MLVELGPAENWVAKLGDQTYDYHSIEAGKIQHYFYRVS